MTYIWMCFDHTSNTEFFFSPFFFVFVFLILIFFPPLGGLDGYSIFMHRRLRRFVSSLKSLMCLNITILHQCLKSNWFCVVQYYIEPASGRRFRSKVEVDYFLQTGNKPNKKAKPDADANVSWVVKDIGLNFWQITLQTLARSLSAYISYFFLTCGEIVFAASREIWFKEEEICSFELWF